MLGVVADRQAAAAAALPPSPQSAEAVLRDAARELSRRPRSSEQDGHGTPKKEGGTPITVCVRVRPLNAVECDHGSAWNVKVREPQATSLPLFTIRTSCAPRQEGTPLYRNSSHPLRTGLRYHRAASRAAEAVVAVPFLLRTRVPPCTFSPSRALPPFPSVVMVGAQARYGARTATSDGSSNSAPRACAF